MISSRGLNFKLLSYNQIKSADQYQQDFTAENRQFNGDLVETKYIFYFLRMSIKCIFDFCDQKWERFRVETFYQDRQAFRTR